MKLASVLTVALVLVAGFASLAQPEGPYVPSELSASGITDSRGAAGSPHTVPLRSRLEDPGAVVSGRVLNADGTPVTGGSVTYSNNPSWLDCDASVGATGLAAVALGPDGRYEFRYSVERGSAPGHLPSLDADAVTATRPSADW